MSPPVLAVARSLAPQPKTPADASAMHPMQSIHPLKSTRSRRGTINAACRECRLKKLKCDGTRPSCQRCIAKGIDSCEYPVNPGETRFTALKRKNASLVTESDRMQKFINALRSASPSRTQDMLRHFRSADDDGSAKQLLSTSTPSAFDCSPHPLHHRDSDSSISSGPSPTSNPDTPQTPNTSRSRSSNTNTKSIPPPFPFEDDVSLVETPYQPFSDFERPLPSTDALHKCVEAFYTEAGKLFHVFSRSHIEAQFHILAGQGDKQALRLAACELSAVAALGSQYIKETLPEGTEQSMYNAAKQLLEDVVTVDTTRASKVCAILGMFNIMNKQKVAMTFVEMGLNLLSRPPIAQVCPPNMDRGQWMERRKVWRVLVFLETWLSSTLGYVSGLKLPKDSMDPKNFETEGDEVSLEEKVTTEMIKIAVIKFDMLRLSLQFKGLSALTVETITHELRYWHKNLPAEMRLTELENNPEVSFELRRTIYYVNFLYFGAQIMLLRRVLQSMHEQSNLFVGDGTVVNTLIVQANFAARESAKLFRRLYIEGGIVKRCWICIFQAYSSCVLILHHVAEMLYEQHVGGRSVGNLEDELNLANACLDFLGVCSEKDVAAGQFHSTLTRFYATLHATATGRLAFGLDTVNTARDLNELIRRPFKNSDQASPDCCFPWQEQKQGQEQHQQNADDLPIRDLANVPDESLSCDSWQRIDGIKNDGMIHDLLSSIRPGHFITGFESSAWTDSTHST